MISVAQDFKKDLAGQFPLEVAYPVAATWWWLEYQGAGVTGGCLAFSWSVLHVFSGLLHMVSWQLKDSQVTYMPVHGPLYTRWMEAESLFLTLPYKSHCILLNHNVLVTNKLQT